jgi:hypothetical protein
MYFRIPYKSRVVVQLISVLAATAIPNALSFNVSLKTSS